MEMFCAFCIVVFKDDVKKAETVMNGQAVCGDHSYYAQGGEFTRILNLIKSDIALKAISAKEKVQEGGKTISSVVARSIRRRSQ